MEMKWKYPLVFLLLITIPLNVPGDSANLTSNETWTLINGNAAFYPREFHTATVFNDRIWVIGGGSGLYPPDQFGRNDIWSSPDGENWSEQTPHAAFPPRFGHGAISFHGKLWVIGGRLNMTSMNDVWSSDDGRNWTLVTEHAGFSPRFSHGVTAFHDRLWVIGGIGGDNDVWSSVDGTHWTLETPHAGFTSRYGHGVVVFDDRLWVIGGCFHYFDRSRNMDFSGWAHDVWASVDGVTWTVVNGSAAFPGLEFCPVVVYDNNLWIVGGGRGWLTPTHSDKSYVQNMFSTVWCSQDGNNWTVMTGDAGFTPRVGHAVVGFKNKLWLIGGVNKNDIWSYQSPDLAQTAAPTDAVVEVTNGSPPRDITSYRTTPSPTRSAGQDPGSSSLLIATSFAILLMLARNQE